MILLVFLFAVACAEVTVTKDGILELTSKTFQEGLDLADYTLVEFFAPWCGHCKALAPEYIKAANKLATADEYKELSVKLATVDATVETDLASKFGIRGYPTIKFFRKGSDSPTDFNGGRTGEDILLWLKKKTGPPAKTFSSEKEATDFKDFVKSIESDSLVVMGFFKETSSEEAKAFLDAAASMDDYEFGVVSDEAVMKSLGAADKQVIIFRNFDETEVKFSGNFESKAIQAFISANSLPYIIEFSDETAPKIFGGDIKVHSLLFCDKAESASLLDEYKKSAIALKGKAVFIHLDISKESNSRVMEFFNLKKEDGTQLRVIKMEKDMEKYNADLKELNQASISEFVENVLNGKVKKHLMTEDVPSDWDAASVKVLVGKNFADVALDSTKDVLVEFYAPWCGHCKALAPIYDELGEHFKDNANVVIAKMDSTKNEQDTVSVQGFPTIYLFRSGDNKAITFNGGRTLDDLKSFVESKGESHGEDDEGEAAEEEQESDDSHDEL